VDTIEDPGRDLRRESQRGLVEQQQIGIHHQRPCDFQHLLLAARERLRPVAGFLLKDREPFVDRL
jgi:hypothetical protein